MSGPWHRTSTTMTRRVLVALESVPSAGLDRVAAGRAAMYAEAIDDDDEGDGLFRFGARLRTALETLGLAPVAHELRLPPRVSGGASKLPRASLADGPGAQVHLGPWTGWRSEDAYAA